MHIPLETVGLIRNSDKHNHKVRVADDSESTGGFLVYEWWQGSDGPNQDFAFDSWVESELALQQFFKETGWLVQWAAA
jgi:hypothetical protein